MGRAAAGNRAAREDVGSGRTASCWSGWSGALSADVLRGKRRPRGFAREFGALPFDHLIFTDRPSGRVRCWRLPVTSDRHARALGESRSGNASSSGKGGRRGPDLLFALPPPPPRPVAAPPKVPTPPYVHRSPHPSTPPTSPPPARPGGAFLAPPPYPLLRYEPSFSGSSHTPCLSHLAASLADVPRTGCAVEDQSAAEDFAGSPKLARPVLGSPWWGLQEALSAPHRCALDSWTSRSSFVNARARPWRSSLRPGPRRDGECSPRNLRASP